MDAIDQLLAQVKAEYVDQGKAETVEKPLSNSNESVIEQSQTPTHQAEALLNLLDAPEDETLMQLKAELRSENAAAREKKSEQLAQQLLSQSSSNPSLEGLTAQVETLLQSSGVPSSENSVLAQLKVDYAEQDKAEALRRQQQQQEEQRRQQQLQQQRLEALTKEAQAWLAKLEPFSDEGMWFESFAEKYPSKLEAAIEYLQALQKPQ